MNGYHIVVGFGALALSFSVFLLSVIYAFWLRAKRKFSFSRMALFGFSLTFVIVFSWGLWDLSNINELILGWEHLVERGKITNHGYKHALFWAAMAGILGFSISTISWVILRFVIGNKLNENQT